MAEPTGSAAASKGKKGKKTGPNVLASVQLLRIRRFLSKKGTMNKYQKSLQDDVKAIESQFPTSTLDMTMVNEEQYLLLQRFAQGADLTDDQLSRAKQEYVKRKEAYIKSLLNKQVDTEGTEEYWRGLFGSMARLVDYVVKQQQAADAADKDLAPRLLELVSDLVPEGDKDSGEEDDGDDDGEEDEEEESAQGGGTVTASRGGAGADITDSAITNHEASATAGSLSALSDTSISQTTNLTKLLIHRVMGDYLDGLDRAEKDNDDDHSLQTPTAFASALATPSSDVGLAPLPLVTEYDPLAPSVLPTTTATTTTTTTATPLVTATTVTGRHNEHASGRVEATRQTAPGARQQAQPYHIKDRST